ncbi:hypothetical protein KAU33_02665 [Candidatus Dependentiae bacterium]|nr:hypothetical protein [Candidatus Dependentiae bacterium]
MFKVNLITDHIQHDLEKERYYSILILVSIVTILFMIINLGFNISYIIDTGNELENFEQVSVYRNEIKNRVLLDNNHLNNQITRFNTFSHIYNSRSNFSSQLNTLTELSSDDLWFDNVEYIKKSTEEIFEIRGTASGTEQVTEFMKRIRNSFKNLNKLKLKSSESFKSGGRDFLKFEIYLSLES